MRPRAVSVVISSYNYERFLAAAIDSAFEQTHDDVEVIVVDDGSTDDSRDIISGYGKNVTAILKENGGQASALNAGYRKCRGELVCFLDSDDILFPTALGSACALVDEATAKVHWPLARIDAHGRDLGGRIPPHALPEGNCLAELLDRGPAAFSAPPTSGNAWSRRFLERVLPIPEPEYRVAADAYLLALSPLYGGLAAVPEPQTGYRLHDGNENASRSFDERLAESLGYLERQTASLRHHCALLGHRPDTARWADTWWHHLRDVAAEIAEAVPAGGAFILVDDQQYAMDETHGRRAIPFLERAGEYWGHPEDDDAAIADLERLRAGGAVAIVFAAPSLWWLDDYPGFARHLRDRYRLSHRSDRLVVFELSRADPA
jgi:hypothetical protein